MVRERSPASRVRAAALVWADAVAYALVVAGVATLAALVVGVATGGGLVRAKTLLFLLGLALMAYATVRLWPSSPEDVRDRAGRERRGASLPPTPAETRFQAVVRTLPPVRWLRPPAPERRLSPAVKLFLGSVAVLLTSFLLEAVFGVG